VATAGLPFAQQPIIRVLDAFGNFCAADGSTVVSAASNEGTGQLQGTLTATAVNGLASFISLSHDVSLLIYLRFTAPGLSEAMSDFIAVYPAAASKLVFTVQPGMAIADLPFGLQPVVQSADQYGNPSAVGLAGNLPMVLTLSSGSGPLLGTTTLDIGTSAGNGTVSFTNLEIDMAGTNKQLSASASGLTSGLSSVFSVEDVTPRIVAIKFEGPNSYRIVFTGTAGTTYTIQYTETLANPNWQPLGTATADSAGMFQYLDTPPAQSRWRFYRASYP
jgi:hypothetical protein